MKKPQLKHRATPGRVRCLSMMNPNEHYFNSPDKCRIRKCPKCSERERHLDLGRLETHAVLRGF